MPSQCSICRSLVNGGHRKHSFPDIHRASVFEIACPAPVSGVEQKFFLLVANLDTSNVLRSLEILTGTLRTVSLPQDQQGERGGMHDLFPVCLESCDVSSRLVNRARSLSFRGHTSIVYEVFRNFSQCSSLFAKINDQASTAFLCFFDCFLDAKDQIRPAMKRSESASFRDKYSSSETALRE